MYLLESSRDALVFILGFPLSSMGERVTAAELGMRISEASSGPVYSLWEFHIGTGILGGHMISGADQGKKVVELANRILDGTPAGEIPVITQTPLSYIFDYNQLQLFNLSTVKLPKGSIVKNKPFSFYETYRETVHTYASILICLIVLVILLLFNIAKRKKVEVQLHTANLNLEDRVEAPTREIRDLSSLNEHIIADSTMGILVFDDLGKCIETNNAAVSILGGTREQILRHVYPKIAIWRENGLYSSAPEPLETGKTGKTGKKQVNTKSSFGKSLWVNYTFTPFTK